MEATRTERIHANEAETRAAFAAYLTAQREARGMNKSQMARHIHVDPRDYREYEAARIMPSAGPRRWLRGFLEAPAAVQVMDGLEMALAGIQTRKKAGGGADGSATRKGAVVTPVAGVGLTGSPSPSPALVSDVAQRMGRSEDEARAILMALGASISSHGGSVQW